MIFHRHALVVCDNRYWCSFDSLPDMPIEAILDACNLHLIYLCPRMFSELKLKKRHGSLTSFCPPKFPLWTTSAVTTSSDSSHTGFAAGDQSTPCILPASQYINSNIPDESVISPYGNLKGGNAGTDSRPITSDLTLPNNNVVTIVDTQLLNPVTLKESCCQLLVQSCIISKPPTLFSICVDYISWSPNTHYNCSMLLPKHMNTATIMMELLDHTAEPISPHVKIIQVRLYDNIPVNPRVKKYLLDQAKLQSYQVILCKLSDQTIYHWSHKANPTWQDIDPYSGLEDIGSSDMSITQREEASTSSTQYSLREHSTRKKTRASTN